VAEINDDIALRWALRDVLAKRHHFVRVSDEKPVMLAERGWIKVEDMTLSSRTPAAPHCSRPL